MRIPGKLRVLRPSRPSSLELARPADALDAWMSNVELLFGRIHHIIWFGAKVWSVLLARERSDLSIFIAVRAYAAIRINARFF